MTTLSFQSGTAFDLFTSLYVLHRPADFGLRPSWAAGVRSRLPAAQREFLERAYAFLPVPLAWLESLPESAKSSAGALRALAGLPAAQRIEVITILPDSNQRAVAALHRIAQTGGYASAELEVVRAAFLQRGITPRPGQVQAFCEAWTQPKSFGEQYLDALRAYYHVFFVEEEKRIAPALENGLAEARWLAERSPLNRLVEQLSRGVRFEDVETASELILVPSYWAAPLVFFARLENQRRLLMFGCRPETETLIPGDTVPDTMLKGLEALADSTRLRILKYLAGQPLTPTELAARLRLRPPTVIHHLNLLRLAGLVVVELFPEGERRYTLRRAGLEGIQSNLKGFLGEGQEHHSEETSQ